jgi:membrane associated rhomboid family serine protease
MARFVGYPFVHGTTTQAPFVVVILLALGKIGGRGVPLVGGAGGVLRGAIIGALAYGWWPRVPLFGAYPGDYGLIGAFTYLMWLRLAGSGREYRAFSMIGLLLGAQLIFGVLFGGGMDWVADLAGFAAGFALTILVTPGGIGRMMDRLRQR